MISAEEVDELSSVVHVGSPGRQRDCFDHFARARKTGTVRSPALYRDIMTRPGCKD
jgi:hypothetical protein